MRPLRPFASIIAACVLALSCATVVSAQDVPSYARPDAPQETIAGRILAVDGAFHLTLRDARGFVDEVQLRANTVIAPVGLALAPGMDVTIVGSNGGDVFVADEIDTPYSYDGEIPPPAYYGDGWWYPGFAYGYGPAFSLGFAFGSGYVYARPFHGHAYHGGSNGPVAPVYAGPALRHTLGAAPARARDFGAQRRVYGAPLGPSTRMDQVSPANVHRADPQVYTVAPAPAPHSAPAARGGDSSHAASSSSRH